MSQIPKIQGLLQIDMAACYRRRPRILLGVTGSVAAVKGPKLALRLANELKADVKVVLTRTVEQYFWKEGRAVSSYDGDSWREFNDIAVISPSILSEDCVEDGDWKSSSGSISIHCKYVHMMCHFLYI